MTTIFPHCQSPTRTGIFRQWSIRDSLARDIIRDRRAAGLTQQGLADLIGARQETISRIETGKHTASVKLVDKIDRVLQRELKKSRNRKNAENRQ